MPPEVPQSMNSMPCSASVAACCWESRKFELPPSTTMSPPSSSPLSCVTAAEVGAPAGIISQTTRGRCLRAATAPSSVPAQLIPYCFSSDSSPLRVQPTTVWPASERRCAMFPPIRPRPIIASSMSPSLVSHVGGRSGRAAGTDPVKPLPQCPHQRVERVRERPDAIQLQAAGDVLEIDSGLLQPLELPAGLIDIPVDRSLHHAVVHERGDGRIRHRVHTLRPDQVVDVENIRVGRVLGAGGGPQRPLHAGAVCRQRLPAIVRLDLEVALVGEL